MASLLELQQAFGEAIRRPGSPVAVRPAGNLDIYRGNSEWQFRNALSSSYPVLKRRVGDDYFHELATLYRQRFPSRSGDLHWAGREFPAFLADHLHGGDYAWLADLARLEWAREAASVVDPLPSMGPEVLGQFAPDDLGRVGFTLQPSLQLLSSPYPVLSIWKANQVPNAPPVDQSVGPECVMILSGRESVEIAALTPTLFSYLCELARGRPLAEAVSVAGLDEAGLLESLRFMFAANLVTGTALADQSANR